MKRKRETDIPSLSVFELAANANAKSLLFSIYIIQKKNYFFKRYKSFVWFKFLKCFYNALGMKITPCADIDNWKSWRKQK
jgi:hypothetical protein